MCFEIILFSGQSKTTYQVGIAATFLFHKTSRPTCQSLQDIAKVLSDASRKFLIIPGVNVLMVGDHFEVRRNWRKAGFSDFGNCAKDMREMFISA